GLRGGFGPRATIALLDPFHDAAIVDTREMVVIPTLMRRELRLASPVVRQVQPGHRGRVEDVANHVRFVTEFIHHHHTIEDEFLWPVLLGRVPDELAPIVHLMETQHERLGVLLNEVDHRLDRWSASASAEDRDLLATAIDDGYAALAEHFDAEEEQLLPIAAATLHQEEWHRLGEEGRRRSA